MSLTLHSGSVRLLKTVMERSTMPSNENSEDEFETFIKDLQEKSSSSEDEVEDEEEDDPPIRSSEFCELNRRLLDLIEKFEDPKPVATLNDIRTTYVGLSINELIALINSWKRFVYYSTAVAIKRSKEADSSKSFTQAEAISTQWEKLTKASLEKKPKDDLQQVLVNAFNDIRTSVETIEQTKR